MVKVLVQAYAVHDPSEEIREYGCHILWQRQRIMLSDTPDAIGLARSVLDRSPSPATYDCSFVAGGRGEAKYIAAHPGECYTAIPDKPFQRQLVALLSDEDLLKVWREYRIVAGIQQEALTSLQAVVERMSRASEQSENTMLRLHHRIGKSITSKKPS